MIVLWIMFLTGLVVIPALGLLALRWAARNGEFRNMDKIALSIFSEEEPVGEMTDHFPVKQKANNLPATARNGNLTSSVERYTAENTTAGSKFTPANRIEGFNRP